MSTSQKCVDNLSPVLRSQNDLDLIVNSANKVLIDRKAKEDRGRKQIKNGRECTKGKEKQENIDGDKKRREK